MKLDVYLDPAGHDLGALARTARRYEDAGYDGVWTGEVRNDAFLPLVVAAEHTERVQLGTGVATAFPRSPMHLAHTAHDLQLASGGRFILGLGPQIRTHVEKRLGGTWGQPVARLRELVLALRAIWECWNTGAELDFRGEFYRHTLMTPMFTPPPSPTGPPRVFLAAVGPRMTELAGEIADGLVAHGFTTPAYLREVTVPALERGLARGGRSRSSFEITCPVFVVSGRDERELAEAATRARLQLAFYGSTPAYAAVLAHHGWGALQPELHALSKQGQWEEMGRRIDDDVLHTFAVVGPPEEIPARLAQRYAGVLDRVSLAVPERTDAAVRRQILDQVRAL